MLRLLQSWVLVNETHQRRKLAALRKNSNLKALVSDSGDADCATTDEKEPDAFSIELDGIMELLQDVPDEPPAANANWTTTPCPDAMFFLERQDYSVAHTVTQKVPNPRR